MKKILTSIILFISAFTYAQKEIIIPLDNPAKPAIIHVNSNMGNVTIMGYDKAEFGIKVKENLKNNPEDETASNGMKKLSNFTQNVRVTKVDDNNINVTNYSSKITEELIVRVPVKTNIRIVSALNGDISIENIEGEIDVTNRKGNIRTTQIKGSMVVTANDGKIILEFDEISTESPSSIMNYFGDIDITIPETSAIAFKLKAVGGNIYSDFDIDLKPEETKITKNANDINNVDSANVTKLERWMTGILNGGSQNVTISTLQSDIYIRKKEK